jgi:hypothetical protein
VKGWEGLGGVGRGFVTSNGCLHRSYVPL